MGVRLIDIEDIIVWNGNKVGSQLTTKSTYDTIYFMSSKSSSEWWSNTIWKWNLWTKLKIFLWLILKNKSWLGTIFIREEKNDQVYVVYVIVTHSESVEHVFVQFCFGQNVWWLIHVKLKIEANWDIILLIESWKTGLKDTLNMKNYKFSLVGEIGGVEI